MEKGNPRLKHYLFTSLVIIIYLVLQVLLFLKILPAEIFTDYQLVLAFGLTLSSIIVVIAYLMHRTSMLGFERLPLQNTKQWLKLWGVIIAPFAIYVFFIILFKTFTSTL